MNNFEFEYNGKKLWYSRSVAVLGIVYTIDMNQEVRILVNKRGSGTPDNQGRWNMPCGYVDFDETLEEAVAREVKEETGVELKPYDFVFCGSDSIPDDEKQTITIRYRAYVGDYEKHTLSFRNAEKDEVTDIRWIKLKNANRYDWAFDHDEIIKKYFGDINRTGRLLGNEEKINHRK